MATLTITLADGAGGKPSAPTFNSVVNVLCDNSYPAGGYPVGAAALLPTGATILGGYCEDTDLTGYKFEYDRVNDKLACFESKGAVGAMTELATATALDGKNVRITIVSY